MNTNEEQSIKSGHMIPIMLLSIFMAWIMIVFKFAALLPGTLIFILTVVLLKNSPYDRYKLIASLVFAICSIAYFVYFLGVVSLILAMLLDNTGPGLHH